jgi:glutamyl-tRNA synthetase
MNTQVITRFPPSPTGFLHLGSARTAIFNYLYAKKNSGKIILRFEDTDLARSKKEFEQDIFVGLEWLGLKFDEVHHQSERTLIYRKYIEKMIESGHAYISEESTNSIPEAALFGEDEESIVNELGSRVIRFKNPNKTITFKDEVRGEINVDTTELGDFVIARNIEEPLYHLAVVIDDFEMGVTHIIRGEDGIYNTPRQILIQEAIGATRPIYCHIPFVLGGDKTKLSKRHGAVSISEYKKIGILPEALINYLALLGWNPGNDQEIFSLNELIEKFSFDQIQKSGAVFDMEKLKWFNREYIKKMSDQDLKKIIEERIGNSFKDKPQWGLDRLSKLVSEIRERISTFSDIEEMVNSGDLDYFFDKPKIDIAYILPKSKNNPTANEHETIQRLTLVIENLQNLSDYPTAEEVKNTIWQLAENEGRANVLWPTRYALSGKEKSPDPFKLVSILGKTESINRLLESINLLNVPK